PLPGGQRIASRIRRQVEQRHRRLAVGQTVERFGYGVHVVAPVHIGRRRAHHRSRARREGLAVVPPERLRNGERLPLAAEQVGEDRQRVGQPRGDQRQAGRHAVAGILRAVPPLPLAPQLAYLRHPLDRRVEERLVAVLGGEAG